MDLTPPNVQSLDDVKIYLERMYDYLKWIGNFQCQFMEWQEVDAPQQPADDSARIYAVDYGSGRTALVGLFNTGNAELIVAEGQTSDDITEGESNVFFTEDRATDVIEKVFPSTDSLDEGSTNLYYTALRVIAQINSTLPSTDSLTEGSTNLYFTSARAIAQIAETLPDSIIGTEDQVTVTDEGDGSVTLSTPQDIATDSEPTFNRVNYIAPYHAYGGFQDETETLAVGDDTWTWMTNATNDLWVETEGVGVSLSGDIMTITNTGDYAGNLSVTFSALNGKDYLIRLYNITKATQMGYVIGATATGVTNFTNVTLPLYVEANAGNTLRMEMKCTTDGTDPILKSAVFYLQYLHN